MRAFIALPLPEPFRLALAELRRGLTAAAPIALSAARWVEPDAMHVTLAFLGEIDEAGAEAATKAARSAVLAARGSGRIIGPFELGVAGLVLFPPRGLASVVAAALGRGAAESSALAAAVEDALEAAGRAGGYAFRPREARPFAPHATLARLPRPGAKIDRAALPGPPAASCIIGTVSLFSSTLGPGGPRYETIAEVGLVD